MTLTEADFLKRGTKNPPQKINRTTLKFRTFVHQTAPLRGYLATTEQKILILHISNKGYSGYKKNVHKTKNKNKKLHTMWYILDWILDQKKDISGKLVKPK